MPLFKRPDGIVARDVPPARRIMPFLMKGRNESSVYFEQEIDLTRTLEFIDAHNARKPDKKVSVFHVFLWAATRALNERPRLNRFVSGGHTYQRDGIWISYSAKKALSDDAPIVVLKRKFDPSLSFEELVDFVYGDLKVGRSDVKSHVDKEL
ncbi:MAG: 2-oxo acid dehydrogenase subunit E2, partial [Myxococcaceae bacterium]